MYSRCSAIRLIVLMACPAAGGLASPPTTCSRSSDAWLFAMLCCRWFGIPSYHVQQMFRQAQGTHYLATQVVTNPSTQVRCVTI